MPEAVLMGRPNEAVLCARCHSSDAALLVRTERLCRECFLKYVTTKVLKRLETNKIRGGFNEQQKTLLLPVSFGVSSISLLHVLDSQLQSRVKQGRHAGYTLHVLYVDQSAVLDTVPYQASLDLLKHRFPAYGHSVVRIEDCFDYGIDIEESLDRDVAAKVDEAPDNAQCLQNFIAARSSATSKADLVDILRRRIITAFAKKTKCDGILFGDSTTRLAERTLSETANGRGGFLPWLTADGTLVDGLPCSYPLRDLLKKELNLYADTIPSTLRPLIIELGYSNQPVSSKDSTIDGLMRHYFESVEENYPSIVANVVRTSSKLNPPSKRDDCVRMCKICNHPISDETWGGEQEDLKLAPAKTPLEVRKLCYGCARTMQTT